MIKNSKKSVVNWILLATLLVLVLFHAPQPAQTANLLQNPGFEEPFVNGVAGSWAPWHEGKNADPKPENCSGYYLVLPKWSAELNSALILDGGRSQHVGNQFDTWRAGVMQDVTVTPGSTYRFSFWARGRTSNEQYPAQSDSAVNLGIRAGIDPNGGGLWYQNVTWGGAASPHDNWQQVSVETTAVGNKVTVFVQADLGGANHCRAHLDVWFDKAELVEVGPPPTNTPPPPPPPPPAPPQPVVTNTPVPPADTPTPEIPPTETPIPTDTPTATPEPPQGGIICINAFSDSNGNGIHDPDEGYMAGVTFTIAKDNQAVAQGVSPGTDNPVCFENLDAGSYQVAQIVPASLEMTTAPNTTVEIQEGQALELKFGSRIRTQEVSVAGAGSDEILPTAVPVTATEGGDNTETSRLSLATVSGLLAIVIAIVLLGGLIFMLLRQPGRP